MDIQHNIKIKDQFDLRSSTFEQSVHWVTDPHLIQAHVHMAGSHTGKSLELCCGTGAVSRGLKEAGWQVTGVDISPGMVEQAKQFINAQVADVVNLPFADHSFDLVCMRQAYFLLNDGPAALKEIHRVLKPTGRLILSHLVPYSEVDAEYLRKIHTVKQAQMRKFHTTETLTQELQAHGFEVRERDFVTVRESVTLWMREAPELSVETRQRVCDMVLNSPEEYRRLRKVENVNGEIMENWNFVLLSAAPRANA
ncbi:MAG: methyltransferase domain-containing protein [Bdellovibrionales bacterium]